MSTSPYCYEETPPSLGELMVFAAKHCEPADRDSVSKITTALREHPSEYVIRVVRMKDSHVLVGFAFAWVNTQHPAVSPAEQIKVEIPGIIYEVIVDRAHRNREMAWSLVKSLPTRLEGHPIRWVGNANRVTPSLDRDLSIIRTVFAISLVEGFKKLAESAYLILAGGSHLYHTHQPLMLAVVAMLSLTGLRFFWAVGNIRRHVLRSIINVEPPRRHMLIAVHLPVLFLHAALFFLICRIAQGLTEGGLNHDGVRHFVVSFAILLSVNVIWLGLLLPAGPPSRPERVWIINNISTLAVLLTGTLIGTLLTVTFAEALLAATLLFTLNGVIDFATTKDGYVLRDAFGGG